MEDPGGRNKGRVLTAAERAKRKKMMAALAVLATVLAGTVLLVGRGESSRANGPKNLLGARSVDEYLATVHKTTQDLSARVESFGDSLSSIARELNSVNTGSGKESLKERMNTIKEEAATALDDLKKDMDTKLQELKAQQEERYKELKDLIMKLPKDCSPPAGVAHVGQVVQIPPSRDTYPYPYDAQQQTMPSPPIPDPCKDSEDKHCRRDKIKEAFVHSWKAYKTWAWGHDELMPVSKRGKDWSKAGVGMGLSMLDAITTMWIMGLHDEFDEVREWIKSDLSFDKDISVSAFEYTIRIVGALLSAYELSGEKHHELVEKARELADLLLYAYDTPSAIPQATVNLKTHAHSNPRWTASSSVLSEFGTVQLEFRTLTYHTGDHIYDKKATWIMDMIEARAPPDMLCPTYFSVTNGRWSSDHITLGALGDSFYEYLLKQYLLTGKTETRYRDMYLKAAKGVIDRLLKKSVPSGQTYIAEFKRGATYNKMDHLACFAGGMFALGAYEISDNPDHADHLRVAEELADTCHQMYKGQPTGIAPEIVEFRGGSDMVAGGRASYYLLRPEAVETFMYLWRLTKKEKYREYGWDVFKAIDKWCRVESGGYSGIRSVAFVPPQKDDLQQSFWFAETLKYLYILFSDDDAFDFKEWVLNTEAHPLKIRKRDPLAKWPDKEREAWENERRLPFDDRLAAVRDAFERRQAQRAAGGKDEDLPNHVASQQRQWEVQRELERRQQEEIRRRNENLRYDNSIDTMRRREETERARLDRLERRNGVIQDP